MRRATQQQTDCWEFDVSSPAYPGLIVKDSYWRWPELNQAGNAIDFLMRVLGLSFHDAMRQNTGK